MWRVSPGGARAARTRRPHTPRLLHTYYDGVQLDHHSFCFVFALLCYDFIQIRLVSLLRLKYWLIIYFSFMAFARNTSLQERVDRALYCYVTKYLIELCN